MEIFSIEHKIDCKYLHLDFFPITTHKCLRSMVKMEEQFCNKKIKFCKIMYENTNLVNSLVYSRKPPYLKFHLMMVYINQVLYL